MHSSTKKKKLLKPKPYFSPKRPRKKEIKNTGTPKGLKIFDPFTRHFQGQEMIENGRRTVKFFYFTKLEKPIVEKAMPDQKKLITLLRRKRSSSLSHYASDMWNTA